jgi:Carboxypeptidase regulatory-like domain/TonB dependent receptor-like, beta-barrel/TonB-dependent Receptor Plug Domain
MLTLCKRAFPVLSLAAILISNVQGQTTQGGIVGTVHDQKGANVPDVNLTVTNPSTGLQRQTKTADNGIFRVMGLPTGVYQIRAEAPGFATTTTNGVEIGVDQIRDMEIVLKIGTKTETVEVQSEAALTQTESSKLGEIIDNRKVEELPLNGRDFAQLARLNPGVASSGGGGGQQGGEGGVSGYSSNGQRSTSNNFMVDGIDNNDYFGGAAAQIPSIDSIQEFEVQTNTFAAEYGRNTGSVVNLVTKSGSNLLHGAAYEFFRNDVLDARNYFNDSTFRKSALRLNQFGGTLGGPILKNKTFFFLNYEGFRRAAGITRITNVPTPDERAGKFTDQNGNPIMIAVNPVSQQIFNTLFPESNLTNASGNFISSPLQTDSTNQFLVKVDHHLNAADSLSARFSRTGIDTFYPFTPGQSGTNIPGYGLNQTGDNDLVAISYTHVINPRTLNEARFGFTRSNILLVTEAGPQAATFGFNTGFAPGASLNLGNIPMLSFSAGFVSGSAAVTNLGGGIDQPNRTATNTFQWIDNLSRTTARHSFKVGGDIRYTQLNRLYDLAFNGQITFSGLDNTAGTDSMGNPANIPNPLIDFALGIPDGALQFVGDSHRNFRFTSYGIFAQDSFRLRPNLTLNYGLRYELNTVLNEAHGRLSSWWPQKYTTFLDPTDPNIQSNLTALEASGVVTQNGVGGVYDGDHNNFAPRIGLSWDPFGNGQTVLRAGYGVFYETIIGNIPGNVMLNPPYLPDYFTPFPFASWPDPFGPSSFPVLTITQQNLRTPYAQHFNLGVEHQLPGRMLLGIAYVGTTGTKLPRFVQIDQAYITKAQIDNLSPDVVTRMELLGIPPQVAQFLNDNQLYGAMPSIVRTPYFGFAQLFQAQDSVSSNYHSLQAKLDKRFSHGLSFLTSYTWSHSIDGASVFFGSGANATTIFPQDNYNLNAERGRSDFDIRHRLSFSFNYDVPVWRSLPSVLGKGWELGGILTLQTGQPFSVLTGESLSGTGLGNDRPNLVGDPNRGPHTVQQWFNTSAFALNAPLTFGNAGRNIVTGPGYRDFDFSLIKNTQLGDKVKAQFRAEFFNIVNHPAFAIPSNILAAPNFGTLFQTPDAAQNNVGLGSGGPRLIQFALKLSF